jgi:hypothetical protein
MRELNLAVGINVRNGEAYIGAANIADEDSL